VKNFNLSILAFFIFVFATNTNASSAMKPGLWQDDFTIKSKSGKIEKKLSDLKKKISALPPDQRKMMEAAMASQGAGLSLTNNSVKICISEEQAKNLNLPESSLTKCKPEEVGRTDNYVKLKFNCPGNPPSTGEGEFKLNSPTSYESRASINTFSDGNPETLNVNQKGTWLSADCGNIRSIRIKK
jgi:hypothetical protein